MMESTSFQSRPSFADYGPGISPDGTSLFPGGEHSLTERRPLLPLLLLLLEGVHSSRKVSSRAPGSLGRDQPEAL